ncbi:type IV pilus modification PilV family protein [Paucibacter soli]|uniref:type IV pilus modification PilV family protein n=1 Tax=Paucibacter soli TaxID=3133433 RepID=UPI0030969B71
MVGILIFAFGVLGIVGLQANMTKAQANTKYRAEAANLAYELVGRMWADAPANLSSYTTAKCADNVSCADWDAKLKGFLPSAEKTLEWDGVNSEIRILITWTRPGEGSSRFEMRATVAPDGGA